MQATNFELKDQNNKIHKLSDYKGKLVVLYFYPKDLTSGCTLEAQNFSKLYKEFQKLGAEIIGVSCDDEKTHKKFETKENIPFPLLADTEKNVVNSYGVWVEKSMYGKKYMGIQRDTFLIDKKGEILKHYEKVKPATHPAEVLEDIKAMN